MKIKDAEELVKAWTTGNRHRKKSLIRKYELKSIMSASRGTLKLGIKDDLAKNPTLLHAGLDLEDKLIFVTGKDAKILSPKEIWQTPKTDKSKIKIRPAGSKKESVDHRLEIMKTLFQAEDVENLKFFVENNQFDLKKASSVALRMSFGSFKKTLLEKTEFKLVTIDSKDKEFESEWYSTRAELSDTERRLNDDPNYVTVSVIKRLMNTSSDEAEKTKTGDEIKLTPVPAS